MWTEGDRWFARQTYLFWRKHVMDQHAKRNG